MKNLILISALLCMILLAHGCLLMHSVSYEINANGKGGSTSVVRVVDIKFNVIDFR